MQGSHLFLFPYEKVQPGTKIMLYGAGVVGQCFLQQLQYTKYCQVVCIVDQRYPTIQLIDGVMTIPPKNIGDFVCDYIVIAIESVILAEEVQKFLVSCMKINVDKIVYNQNYLFAFHYPIANSINPDYQYKNYAYGHDTLSMAFFVGEGLGDCIIAKRFILEFLKLPKCKYSVDLYGKPEYIDAVFSDVLYVNHIFPASVYKRQLAFYDVAIFVGYILSIDAFQVNLVQKRDANFAKQISQMKVKLEQYDLKKPGSNYSIHFARCKKLRLNAYTAFNFNGIIQINDVHVSIPLLKAYEMDFKNLQLKQYITLNFGWGLNPKQRVPAKIWPYEYYNKLIKHIKTTYPKLELVQLGVENSIKLEGVDYYIFGRSLELSKYILKNSLLHIDCEGGLVHLATQLDTKCIVLFGPTPVYYFGYENNINIVSDTCKNCCYLDNDFSICYRNMDQPECMYSITPERVFTYIKQYFCVIQQAIT